MIRIGLGLVKNDEPFDENRGAQIEVDNAKKKYVKFGRKKEKEKKRWSHEVQMLGEILIRSLMIAELD